ncbi:DUF6473 family protein [Phaeobacter sp. QD34_3]|uniref:DUF6473 family protein n=1 Tax=unclassified Phaeobacter TaxID=2621772 RepID=UPI00237FA860|nr:MULTISPECIES: DUF6473 family protein [unclassified Phaeobacter]MDE4132899.1 DUF6473 family protein [Phaeobacter sp. QD34_3]MDE4136699.1 DUF6473 family protein [Phaeobacter sp. QD34_24]MDE4174114.1 DUF6473 family protein [Phaeobacter sp. PT47_59]
MSYELKSVTALSGGTCCYAGSRLQVRGPVRDLDDPYIAFLGGTEVFGRFVAEPFPAVTETLVEQPCVNLGGVNAGLESFLCDTSLMKIARDADLAVVQLLGAQNLSNRYYKVHPRRNDRFLKARSELTSLYPEVDFTEFHFSKHLLSRLKQVSEERFETLRLHLQSDWVSRMGDLIAMMEGRVVLLWLRYTLGGPGLLGREPVLIDQGMVDSLRPLVKGVVELPVSTAGLANDVFGMDMGPLDMPTAKHMLGPKEHNRIGCATAEQLQTVLNPR